MQKSGEDKFSITDSSLKKNKFLDRIKTTNVNVLLNRVRIEEKKIFIKKIFFSSLMVIVISIISIFTIIK